VLKVCDIAVKQGNPNETDLHIIRPFVDGVGDIDRFTFVVCIERKRDFWLNITPVKLSRSLLYYIFVQ
jgi:hypothetical protein